MKTRQFFILSLIILIPAIPAFTTEVTTGLTYDSANVSFPFGTEFAITETFEDNSQLSAGLVYKNSGTYRASFTYSKFLSAAVLSGGFNYDIRTSGISQSIALGTGVVLNHFSAIVSGALRLNPADIFSPDMYNCSGDIIFDTKNRIIGLSFLYSVQKKGAVKENKLGGGVSFTAYEQGAPADIGVNADVYYVDDKAAGKTGFAADAGMKINVYLPFMTIHAKGTADILNPDIASGKNIPFTIGLSTEFKL